MNESRRTFLKQLLATPGPSGYEWAPAKIWRTEAETFADLVEHDVLGNSYAWLGEPGPNTVVIEGHIDEIGFLITYVDDKGFLWFDKVEVGTTRWWSASGSGSKRRAAPSAGSSGRRPHTFSSLPTGRK